MSHALGPSHCRFLSDAVTGVAIVTILFFFPSQKPSLKWWFDFKGKRGRPGPWIIVTSQPVAWAVTYLLGRTEGCPRLATAACGSKAAVQPRCTVQKPRVVCTFLQKKRNPQRKSLFHES